MECDDVSCDGDGKWSDVEFSPDGAQLAFVSTSRDHKDEWVKVADTTTGDVREVYHEHVRHVLRLAGARRTGRYCGARTSFCGCLSAATGRRFICTT